MQQDGTGNTCGGSWLLQLEDRQKTFCGQLAYCSTQYILTVIFKVQKLHDTEIMYVMSYCIALDLQHVWMMYQPTHNLMWTLMNLLG